MPKAMTMIERAKIEEPVDRFWTGELLPPLARLVAAARPLFSAGKRPEPTPEQQRLKEAALHAEMILADVEFRYCRVCGCSEDDACEGGCSWAGRDICSECAAHG